MEPLTVSTVGFELVLVSGFLIPTYAADSGYGSDAGFYLIMAMNM
jgi:hypothetical protein